MLLNSFEVEHFNMWVIHSRGNAVRVLKFESLNSFMIVLISVEKPCLHRRITCRFPRFVSWHSKHWRHKPREWSRVYLSFVNPDVCHKIIIRTHTHTVLLKQRVVPFPVCVCELATFICSCVVFCTNYFRQIPSVPCNSVRYLERCSHVW
jgi:hypothetical protein